jgi:hypothetical protein
MLLKLLLDVLNVSSKLAWRINSLHGHDLELSSIPVGSDFLVKGSLKLELLVS